MGLSRSTKTTIDLVTPSLVAGIVAYVLFTKKKDYTVLLAGAAIAFLLSYIIVSKITKAIVSSGPAPVPTGGGCDGYDPKGLIDAIYEDCTCHICFRKKELYTQLLGISDCQIRTAYNYWNANYYGSTGNKSLPVIIMEQGNSFDSAFEELQRGLAAKFNTLSLQ